MQTRPAYRLSIAPMMDWTDRHCRYLHRQMTRRALLYTEMVTSAALVRGGALHLLDHDPAEYPLALQLGGADPGELAEAVRLTRDRGFAEINLNVGCPSDRVQSGCFGAALMAQPGLVADCVAAMREAAGSGPGAPEITVKCRIGIDEQDPAGTLPRFLDTVAGTGVRRFAIHARKAWLQGLSPKKNREIPPLDHALVFAMKEAFPGLSIVINGGIDSLETAQAMLARGIDGVMIGRTAYQTPQAILPRVDGEIFASTEAQPPGAEEVVAAMLPYVAAHLARGGRLHEITRHMLGLFTGRPGARAWRRILSQYAPRPGAGVEVLHAALAAVAPEVRLAAG